MLSIFFSIYLWNIYLILSGLLVPRQWSLVYWREDFWDAEYLILGLFNLNAQILIFGSISAYRLCFKVIASLLISLFGRNRCSLYRPVWTVNDRYMFSTEPPYSTTHLTSLVIMPLQKTSLDRDSHATRVNICRQVWLGISPFLDLGWPEDPVLRLPDMVSSSC